MLWSEDGWNSEPPEAQRGATNKWPKSTNYANEREQEGKPSAWREEAKGVSFSVKSRNRPVICLTDYGNIPHPRFMKLCLFSVSYAGFWGQTALPLPEFIVRAGRLGYASVMLAGKRPHVSPLDATSDMLQSVKGALKTAGVSCDVIAAYTNFASGSAAEVPLIDFQIAYVESLARIAAELGASVVRVFTAYESPGQDLPSLWNRVVAALGEICDRAAAHGVTIAIQNHHDLGLHTDALLELLADIARANIKLGFDAWSPALRGENL